MCEIQATFSCQEELPPNRRHGIIQLDLSTDCHCRFGSHESGRTTTDNDNLHLSAFGDDRLQESHPLLRTS